MIKNNFDTQTFSIGIGWIIGTIIGLILFALSFFLIEDFGFIIGISMGLGFGTSIGITIQNKDFKKLSQDQVKERKHLLFSSLLLVIFGILIITYVIFN